MRNIKLNENLNVELEVGERKLLISFWINPEKSWFKIESKEIVVIVENIWAKLNPSNW